MVFESKFTAFRVHVRPELVRYHPTTGVEIGRDKAIVAEFGTHGGEYTYEDPDTGRQEKGAIITGHYWDSKIAQEQNNWTDAERETAESVVTNWCSKWPEAVWIHSTPKAGLPWATYNTTPAEQIAALAEATGNLEAAIAYESENEARKAVLKKLNEALEKQAEVPAEESLTAA